MLAVCVHHHLCVISSLATGPRFALLVRAHMDDPQSSLVVPKTVGLVSPMQTLHSISFSSIDEAEVTSSIFLQTTVLLVFKVIYVVYILMVSVPLVVVFNST
jgi:hypothetical protein